MREHAGEYTFGVVLVTILASWLLARAFYYDSPVLKYETVSATVRTAYQIPTRSSWHYGYIVELSDTKEHATLEGMLPLEVGTVLEVERRTRKNGVVTYHSISAP
jgi:hypothetical protein